MNVLRAPLTRFVLACIAAVALTLNVVHGQTVLERLAWAAVSVAAVGIITAIGALVQSKKDEI